MRKIRLNVADLGATEILSREQLKSVFGGSGSGSSGKVCSANKKVSDGHDDICFGADEAGAEAYGSTSPEASWCCNCAAAYWVC